MICIVCDRFIIGTEKLCWIDPSELKKSEQRLSVENYETNLSYKLPSELRDYYKVDHPDLSNMLLSKRAFKEKSNGKFSCCNQCNRALKRKVKTPPKYSISNGFAIGSLPEEMSELNDLVALMIAPIRPFSYVISYGGGSHKKLKGVVTFFENSPEYMASALQSFSSVSNNPNIYCILCGRMTPKQKQMARLRSRVNINQYLSLYNWMKKNNKTFEELPELSDVPKPIVIEDTPNQSNTDEERDPEREQSFDFKYYFPSLGEPDQENGAYDDKDAFASAVLKGQTPVLMLHPKNYFGDKNLHLPSIFPLQFPFGFGGFKDERPVKVSEIECLKHYMRLSSPSFRRQDFVLVSCHIYHRIRSFQTAYIKCQAKFQNTKTLAERVSTFSEDDLHAAMLKRKKRMKTNHSNPAEVYLQTVSASCAPVGNSNEAADYGRKKYMALWNLFGPGAIFLTTSPCDECSFRMKLFATSKPHKLPSLEWTDDECVADLKFRQNLRLTFPGAGALEYQSIMQIVIEKMLGWDIANMKKKKNGIFGSLQAYGLSTEEQNRSTLHGHMILWIEGFNIIRSMLFSDDDDIRSKARSDFTKYVGEVMCSSYEGLKVEDHIAQNGGNNLCEKHLTQVADQKLRNMRHKTKCLDEKGVVGECQGCKKSFSVIDILENTIKRLQNSENQLIPTNIQFPILKERLDVLAMRYPYQVLGRDRSNPTNYDKINDFLVKFRFNEHDCFHRPGCFKKGNECRFKLPKQISEEVSLSFGDEESKWFSVQGEEKKVTSFDAITKRLMGDQFLNTFSPAISGVFGYNTNVQIGSVSHMYYNTLYGSKSNQDDETRDFISVCNVIARRIKKQQENNENDPNADPEFCEGLARIFVGIRAHLSSYVISAPLAYHLLTRETRFEFSHDFSHHLLAQMEDYIKGENIYFKLRRRKRSNNDEEIDQWVDCFTYNIIYRPDEMENICSYQQIVEYEISTIETKKGK